MISNRDRRRALYTAAAVLVLAGGGILAFASALLGDPVEAPSVRGAREEVAVSVAAPAPAPAAGPASVEGVVTTVAAKSELAAVHPHPITPAHERLRRQRNLVSRLDDAIDARDPDELRRALAHYQQEFPEEQRLLDGYGIIAACLENAPSARVEAQAFYDANRGSTLRRWVRRTCLDPSP